MHDEWNYMFKKFHCKTWQVPEVSIKNHWFILSDFSIYQTSPTPTREM